MRNLFMMFAISLGACCQLNNNTYSRKLREAYENGEISLTPPLSKYKGLIINIDKNLAETPGFVGIRVDLNTPHAPLRKFGEHPTAITYFFEDKKFVRKAYGINGDCVNTTTGRNQIEAYVDTDFVNHSPVKLRSHTP